MQATFFAICLLLIVKTSEEYIAKEIIIDRPSFQYMNGGLVDGIRLTVSSGASLGSTDDRFECEDFNAEHPSGVSSIHQCECTSESSTFSFFDGKWKCVDNEEFRQSEGKSTKLIEHFKLCVYNDEE